MKCIRCGTDARKKDREDGLCPSCKGRFAFDPTAGDPFTDRGMQAAIERVSSKGLVKFTERHVWWEVQRAASSTGCTPALGCAGIVAVLGIGLGVAAAVPVAGVVVGLIGLLFVAIGVFTGLNAAAKVMPLRDFQRHFQRYVATHGEPTGLTRVTHAPRDKAAEVGWDELLAYSFERAVITDTAENAATLIANDFHFENSVAVLSADGYPSHAFDGLRQMLRQNGDLEVFVLHDCTPEGCRLARRLATDPDWFGGTGARVREVALRPEQAVKLKARTVPVAEPVAADVAISTAEAAWLSQHRAELAWLRPEQLIKRLFRELNRELPERGVDGGGGDDYGGDPHFFLIADVSDGGGGSFG